MTTPLNNRPPQAQLLIRKLVHDGGQLISLSTLVSGWMAQNPSAQLLFEQLDSMLLQGDLALVYAPESTQVRLTARSPDRRTCRRSESLSQGEAVEFAAAASRVHRAGSGGLRANGKPVPFQVPRPPDPAQATLR